MIELADVKSPARAREAHSLPRARESVRVQKRKSRRSFIITHAFVGDYHWKRTEQLFRRETRLYFHNLSALQAWIPHCSVFKCVCLNRRDCREVYGENGSVKARSLSVSWCKCGRRGSYRRWQLWWLQDFGLSHSPWRVSKQSALFFHL